MKKENKIYMNRELSWLKFNERVLDEAKREGVPLCERLTFLSIYQTNLEEFFRVRVGSLQDQNLICPNDKENKTNMTPAEQINAIFSRVRDLTAEKMQYMMNFRIVLQGMESDSSHLKNLIRTKKVL